MKKILKEPNANKYLVTCDCKCKFSCEDEDIEIKNKYFLLGKIGTKSVTECPCCHKEIELNCWNCEVLR